MGGKTLTDGNLLHKTRWAGRGAGGGGEGGEQGGGGGERYIFTHLHPLGIQGTQPVPDPETVPVTALVSKHPSIADRRRKLSACVT